MEWEDTTGSYGTGGIASGGDFDGDGLDDVAFHDISSNVFLYYGGTTGSYELMTDADAVLSWSSNVGASYMGVGRPIHFGDFDQDGLDDLLIGMPASDSNGYRAGSVLHLPGGL